MEAKKTWLAKVPGRAWVIAVATLALTAMGTMYFVRCGGGLRLFRSDDAVAASMTLAVALLAAALDHAFKTRATKFIRLALVGLLVLATALCLLSPSRRAGAVAFFRGDTHGSPSAPRLLALQDVSVRALRSTPWFAPENGGDAARALPVRLACMAPAISARVFGRWFPMLGLVLYGVLAVALVCCWRRARSEAKKVFVFFSGAGVLVPAALGFGGSLDIAPMMYVNVPLLSFGLASLLTTWILLGAVERETKRTVVRVNAPN